MDKQAWRELARTWAPTTPGESRAVADHLTTCAAVAGATRACLFLPMPGEVDLRALPARLPEVHWVTTRTADATTLTVHDLQGPMERHPYGYLQPTRDAPRHDPASVDAWLVPGLAFAADGTRLGHGRGYYDRLLAARGPDATLVAVTVARRVVAALPAQPHDVSMHLLATEQGVAAVRSGHAVGRVDPAVVSPPSPGSPGTAR